MDTVRHLLSFFLKISVAIFFLVLVIWLVALIPRSQQVKNDTPMNASTTIKSDILPSPRKYSGLFSFNGNPTKAKTFVEPEPYVYTGTQPGGTTISNAKNPVSVNGYSYPTYTYVGNSNVPAVSYLRKTGTSSTTGESQVISKVPSSRELYLRNLSLYEGGRIYTGLSFIGEAHSNLFREGRFPIVVVDTAGRVIGFSFAIATTQWAVPGWVRFEAKINFPLPKNTPCIMVFEEALTQTEKTRQPLRVPLSVTCN